MRATKKVRDTQLECTIKWALRYLGLGYCSVPVQEKEKGPRIKGWPDLRVDEEYIYSKWTEPNIALLLGPPSNYLVDVNLKCYNARIAAQILLPRTRMVYGRRSALPSHYFYKSEVLKRLKLNHPETNKCLVMLKTSMVDENGKIKGACTLVPPSIHPSGERLKWYDPDDFYPKKVKAKILIKRIHLIGVVCLLKSIWNNGSGHCLALSLAEIMAKANYSEKLITKFIITMCFTARDEDSTDKIRLAKDIFDNIKRGSKIAGKRRLKEIIQNDVVFNRVLEWLTALG